MFKTTNNLLMINFLKGIMQDSFRNKTERKNYFVSYQTIYNLLMFFTLKVVLYNKIFSAIRQKIKIHLVILKNCLTTSNDYYMQHCSFNNKVERKKFLLFTNCLQTFNNHNYVIFLQQYEKKSQSKTTISLEVSFYGKDYLSKKMEREKISDYSQNHITTFYYHYFSSVALQ